MAEIINKIKENFKHYLVLAVILNIGFFCFVYFQYVRIIQFIAVILTGIAFVAWGIIHHSIEGDLHIRVVLEYVSTVILGILVIWFLLLRA